MRRLVLLLAVWLLSAPASAAIAFVDWGNGTLSGTTCAFSNISMVNGNAILVSMVTRGQNPNTVKISNVVDNGTTAYTLVDEKALGTTNYIGTWKGVFSGSPSTITVTSSGTTTGSATLCLGATYSGVVSFGVTTSGGVSGTGTTCSAALVTQDNNNWNVMTCGDGNGASGGFSAGAGTTLDHSDGTAYGAGHIASATPASVTANLTLGSDTWVGVAIELRTASGGGAAAVPTRTIMGVGTSNEPERWRRPPPPQLQPKWFRREQSLLSV